MSLLVIKDGKNLSLKGLTENKIKNVSDIKLSKIGSIYVFIFYVGVNANK